MTIMMSYIVGAKPCKFWIVQTKPCILNKTSKHFINHLAIEMFWCLVYSNLQVERNGLWDLT
jgi:hypothetical protein